MRLVILIFSFISVFNIAKAQEVSIIVNMKPSVFINPPNTEDDNFCGNKHGNVVINNTDITAIFSYQNGICISSIGYYANTEIIYRKVAYLNGKRNGVDETWYKSGQKMSFAYYEEGQLKSPIIEWFEDGNIKSLIDVNWTNNHGFTKVWFENGNIKSEENFIDSTLKGVIVKNYFENGKLRNIEYGNLGKRPYLEYYPNGVKGREGKIINAYWNKIGKWQEWYENGVKMRDYFFDENQPNIKTGTWSWWDEKGNLIKQEIYKNNELIEEKNFLPFGIKND